MSSRSGGFGPWDMIRAFVSVFLMFILWFGCANYAHSRPIRSQVEAVWESDPDIIVAMVQKLYVLENATPVLVLPSLTIIELDDGSTRVEYSGIMELFIGTEEHNLSYAITLKPKNVVIGYTPQPRFPWEWLVIGGIALAGGGFVAGVLATR